MCYNELRTLQMSNFLLTFRVNGARAGRGEVLVIASSVPCEAPKGMATAL